ncbi:exocyst complex component 4-like [Artemia franciscana]|uniref:Exocyst complex component Sec8 n=1 Tax=Artemia franciscana TaxID=6661 RepID=A0AA88KSS1_ARTSF|nr:hypothetical protein QYM36_017282 [Artemia franciscana]
MDPSESQSLLMQVIRLLSATGENDQREKEKIKLERSYRETDARVDKYVNKYADTFEESMKAYSDAMSRVSETLEKIRDVRSQLSSCRVKLRYKHDELRRLWEESQEHETMCKILNDIQELKDVNDELLGLIDKKQYAKASQLLCTTVKALDGPLSQIDGLNELRKEVENKREIIYNALLSNVEKLVFEESCKSVLFGNFQRVPSSGSGREKLQQLLNPGVREAILSKVETGRAEEFQIIKLTNLCQSLVEIGKLQNAIDKININMCPKFRKIIENTLEYQLKQSDRNIGQFLELVVQQVRHVVNALNQTRTAFATVANQQKLNVQMFSVKQVWTAVQVEIQDVLHRHITKKNGSSDLFPVKHQVSSFDFNEQFRRRTNRPLKSLFTFRSSAVGLALESKSDKGAESNMPLLCQPGADNLVLAYITLRDLMKDIDVDIGYTSGSHCELYNYVAQTATESVMDELEIDLENSLSEIDRKAESTYALISDPVTLAALEAKEPIYQWCIEAEKIVRISCHLASNIPTVTNKNAEFLIKALSMFLEKVLSNYRSTVDEDLDDRRILSASWVKDNDIARLLKSLPSWKALEELSHDSPEHETPEEALDKFAKESKVLISNLPESSLSSNEMINDLLKMKALGTLHESLEWFTWKINGYIRAAFKNLKELESVQRQFSDLSDTCLLILHLEIRIHCFYHLSSQMRNSNYWLLSESPEPDVEITKLCQHLSNVDILLSPVLQRSKQKYIIEGVGHFCGSILISNASTIAKINAAGARKMVRNIVTLSQTMNNLSGRREPGLERAGQYYEMLVFTPDELLDSILEKGKLFTELEYADALKLLNRSRGGSPRSLSQQLDRLTDLFEEVGVAV